MLFALGWSCQRLVTVALCEASEALGVLGGVSRRRVEEACRGGVSGNSRKTVMGCGLRQGIPRICCKVSGEKIQKQADVGDDTGGFHAAAIREFGDDRR